MACKNVTGNSEITYSLFYGNGLDTLNCNIDLSMTLFTDAQFDSDYNLLQGSPCIDAGTFLVLWQSDTVLYLSPNQYFGSYPDIGAKESPFNPTGYSSETYPNFKIYPNPTSNYLSIKLENSNDNDLKIYSILGELIFLNNNQSTITIDVSKWNRGVYIIQNGGISKKLMLK